MGSVSDDIVWFFLFLQDISHVLPLTMEKELVINDINAKIILTEALIDANDGFKYCSDSKAGGNFMFVGTTRSFERITKSGQVGQILIKGLVA